MQIGYFVPNLQVALSSCYRVFDMNKKTQGEKRSGDVGYDI